RLLGLFEEEERPEKKALQTIISTLQQECEGRGIELREVSSGYRYQARTDVSRWVSRLWEERAPRYSRALLETLALVAYRQPITRAEIEDIRGVAVSSSIMKTLQERGWVRIVGHRDVPGKPAMYASTREFLDYFNLKSLDELPTLSELRDIDKINAELDLRLPGESGAELTNPDDPQAVVARITADFEPVEY
ncbi:MAG TPA: SMC-Scp complex subunit ScpB, partial [Gammaproteobacteria bacterium]